MPRQLRELVGKSIPTPLSIRNIAQRLGIGPPISLSDVLDSLNQPNKLHIEITTPPGTALGGWVELELRPDGGYTFKGHMHGSGFDPYDFRVLVIAQSNEIAFAFQHTGHVDGTGSDLLGSPHRDDDWNEAGSQENIRDYWLDARTAKITASKSYTDAGLLAGIENLGKLIASWWITESLFGPEVAVVIVAGSELGNLTGIRFANPTGLAGVAVAGATILVFGPNVIVPAIIAGVGAALAVEHRQMQKDETDLAALVFGNTLPTGRIVLTNLVAPDGHKFTIPSVDGTILVNLGEALDNPNPLSYTGGGYSTAGQVFIHELTHAWQIDHAKFMPGFICKAVVTKMRGQFEDVYAAPMDGRPWGCYGIEQQGNIVDTWFGTYANGWTNIDDARVRLATAEATSDPAFGYISNNIRLAQG